ncbi:hypothetical protein F5B22DRAFT_646109 [Xylaria bambusicola]|uniref:uncharacterized protein n=1 Tax=Xylaria bambusicola TaxID=326684 RepID=UPI00200873E8|nr:uncharacterized protein F5B22DRAFT_646109 [Xylaria bambusicola]KAI0517120.1 hypothetical protein F5B22DRAFT_646109 [Xylaria bambusicola]
MAPIQFSGEGVDRAQVLQRLDELYKSGFVGKDEFERAAAKILHASIEGDIAFTPKEYDPSVTIPRILVYLRDNDADRDVNWNVSFPLIQGYIAEATHQMTTGGLGYSNPKLRAAFEDAHVMVRTHLTAEKRAREMTQWTDDIMRGQTTQERLLTYTNAFPLPDPDRAKYKHWPVKPMPRLGDLSPVWSTSLKILDPTDEIPCLAEVDNYVESEENYFRDAMKRVKTGNNIHVHWRKENKFATENRAYEKYMRCGPEDLRKYPPPYDNKTIGPKESSNPDGTKGQSFYHRRGWQRAALQQCLNLFTSYENRAINTPWRRPILPYGPPAALPSDTAYAPRVVNPEDADEKWKDPFSWLHWSTQYSQIVDFLADCQRQRYRTVAWKDFSASALPNNFRGPHIYTGLAVHDQHWLKIGQHLENLEILLHAAWGAAPRPLLRAILRDIDAGRRENTGGPNMDNSRLLPVNDSDELQDRKRYWRRDIKRRTGIDRHVDNTEDDNYKLVSDHEIEWLRYLAEPSRTLEMCDPAKLPPHNLAVVFDVKLQSFFQDLELSGGLNYTELSLWAENRHDIDEVVRTYNPPTLSTALAYINGSLESELIFSGDMDPNPEHPNACYQFSVEEAEFCCIELQQLGRCIYIPRRGEEPARVGRPNYNVHPEDRVTWRYQNSYHFRESNEEQVEDMVLHYQQSYGSWALCNGDRPRFARELEFMLDHAGFDFTPELQRVETQKQPTTTIAAAKRREFIHKYIVPEGLFSIGDASPDDIEYERDFPYRADIAPWEAVGAHLTKYHEYVKQQRLNEHYYYSGEPYFPQTPERTAQFFRNLAYRMGRTMRYVDQIKERLQVLEKPSNTEPAKASLELSAELIKPRPIKSMKSNTATSFPVIEKLWQPISTKTYDLAIEKWTLAIAAGSGEVALIPPDIKDVLAKADPNSSSQNPLKGNQDPFTIIREGIIDDCFRNRPTMYPGRIGGCVDKKNKEYQGYGRPDLFVWATKDQRRYQAQHTRRYFFNMQRWPSSRILPHRLEAIRERKDETLRVNPSDPDQAYGILTNRLPIGREKPLYAHPIIDHHHGPSPDDWRAFGDYSEMDFRSPTPPTQHTRPPQSPETSVDRLFVNGKVVSLSSASSHSSDSDGDDGVAQQNKPTSSGINNNNDNNVISINTVTIDDDPVNINPFEANLFQATTSGSYTTTSNMPSTETMPKLWDTSKIGTIGGPARRTTGRTIGGTTGGTSGGASGGTTKGTTGGTTGGATGGATGGTSGGTSGGTKPPRRDRPFRGLVPYRRSDERFAPGPAIFPMGDTLLQKVMISEELNSAMYPSQPFYKEPLLGLPKLLKHLASGAPKRLVPLVPPVARSVIPRSNPRKRKMPIEFLNGPATKKFRSDASAPLQRGGNGGQFAAGTMEIKEETVPAVKTEPGITTDPFEYTTETKTPMPSATEIQTPMNYTNVATSLPSLPLFSKPSRMTAKSILAAKFPDGLLTSVVALSDMYLGALVALEFSINHQLQEYGLQTSVQELKEEITTERCKALKPYIGSSKNFPVQAVGLLLEGLGEKYGLKLQLGTVQGVGPNVKKMHDTIGKPGITSNSIIPLKTRLVGSKYNTDEDRIVLWIGLDTFEQLKFLHENPYSGYKYNTYRGVGSVKAQPKETNA